MKSTRDIPSILRPLPFPTPFLSTATINTGRLIFFEILDATIPTTPGCHPLFPITAPKSYSPLAAPSKISIASRVVWLSTSCRALLFSSRMLAISLALDGSSHNSNSKALLAVSIRPAALILGPSLKPISIALNGGLMFDISVNAARPVFVVRAIVFNPFFTKILFSSISGTKSATVPNATMSR